MIGMMQIAIGLLCWHLVFRGVGILQTALASPREKRSLVLANLSLIVCVVVAFVMWMTMEELAFDISQRMSEVTIPAF